MFWKSSNAAAPMTQRGWMVRLVSLITRFTLLSTTFVIGQSYFPLFGSPSGIPYWIFWLAALAGVHWIARQAPFSTLPPSLEAFPNIHALMHCHAIVRAPLKMKALEEELERATSSELDEYARAHLALADALIQALNDPA